MSDEQIQGDWNRNRDSSSPSEILIAVKRPVTRSGLFVGVSLVAATILFFSCLLLLLAAPEPSLLYEVVFSACFPTMFVCLVAVPLVVAILKKLAPTEEITITSTTVRVVVTSRGETKRWAAPVNHYLGILKTHHRGTWQPSQTRKKPTGLCLYLVHRNQHKTVLLWNAESDEEDEAIVARKLWLRYANQLSLVPLEETPYGIQEYHSGDLQEQLAGQKSSEVSGTVPKSTQIQPDHLPRFLEQTTAPQPGVLTIPELPPSSSIQYNAEADSLTITYPEREPKKPEWLLLGQGCLVVVFVTFGLTGLFAALSLTLQRDDGFVYLVSIAFPSLVLLIIGSIVGIAAWTKRNIVSEVIVTPGEISVSQVMRRMKMLLARVKVDELEAIEVNLHHFYSDESIQPESVWAVVLITPTQIEPLGRGLSLEHLRWMKTAIINWLCDWRSRSGKGTAS